MLIRDLSEIIRGEGGVGILNLGSEIRWPIPAMGAKFANPPHELGLKYHDPPPLVWMKKSSSCNTLGWVSIMKTQNIFLICSLSCYIHTYISITFRKPLFFYFFLFLFCQIKNFLFLLWVNFYMITGIYLHDPPPFNGPFFMTPPFSEAQKVVTPPSVSTPVPLLISDKSLISFDPKSFKI